MFIEPNTIIRILKDCPLDTTYNHTLYFDSASAQSTYFASLTKYTLNAQSYQRVRRGAMRVEITADNLYDCNYLMFQNTSFGSKWFYAFITNVEYVNNITAEVTFEIDVMQTWFFDYTLGQNFVEREHSATDVIGENLVPEQVDLGDYINNDMGILALDDINNITYTTASIIFVCTFGYDKDTKTFVDVEPEIRDSVYSGLTYIVFTHDEIDDCNEFIVKVAEDNNWDGIIASYMLPWTIVDGHSSIKRVPKDRGTLDGYTPKNNKLHTYPYQFMSMQTNTDTQDYKYEFWNDPDLPEQCRFIMHFTVCPQPSVVLFPLYYKNVGQPTINQEERMALKGFPQCAISCDTWKIWYGQNCNSYTTGIVTTAVGGVAGAVTSIAGGLLSGEADNVASGVVSGVGSLVNSALSIANTLAKSEDIKRQAPTVKGSQSSSADYTSDLYEFRWFYKSINHLNAAIIDGYFNMFGYATHLVKIPNRNVRPHWTYTKTIGCVITGSMPADAERMICNIYDHGITFWKHGSEVGNYSLDNSPT